MSDQPLKVVFAPGCFDTFEGTQEELDDLVAMIQQEVESGNFLENSRELTDEDWEDMDPADQQALINALNNNEQTRKLN